MFQHTETEQEKLYDICMKSDHPNVMLCPFECHIESKEAKSNTEKLKYKLTSNSIKYITVIIFRNMVLNSQTLQDKENLFKKWESLFWEYIIKRRNRSKEESSILIFWKLWKKINKKLYFCICLVMSVLLFQCMLVVHLIWRIF